MPFKFEKKFTYYAIAIGIIIAVVFFLAGCSSSTEITKKVEETTTIQPVTVTPPKVESKQDLPLINESATGNNITEVYEGTQTVTTKDSSGKKGTATVTNKVTIKKDSKGKTTNVNVESKVQQAPFTTDAKVTKAKVTTDTNTKTEGWGITIWNDVKWWLLGLLIICILAIVIAKKFFPVLLKTYLRI